MNQVDYEVLSKFTDYDKEDLGLSYYTSEFRKKLEIAVDDETISDVPICTILSGGIDSTIITYLLSKKYPDMEAFVVNVNSTRKSKLKDDFVKLKFMKTCLRLLRECFSEDPFVCLLISSIKSLESFSNFSVSLNLTCFPYKPLKF